MGSRSVYLEKAMYAHVHGGPDYTRPATTYLAACLDPWDPTLTGSTLNEPTVGAYARLAVTNNTTNWPAASGGNPSLASNGVDLTFATPTADWGTIQSIVEVDASSGGNILHGTNVPGSGMFVASGTPLKILANTLNIRET